MGYQKITYRTLPIKYAYIEKTDETLIRWGEYTQGVKVEEYKLLYGDKLNGIVVPRKTKHIETAWVKEQDLVVIYTEGFTGLDGGKYTKLNDSILTKGGYEFVILEASKHFPLH